MLSAGFEPVIPAVYCCTLTDANILCQVSPRVGGTLEMIQAAVCCDKSKRMLHCCNRVGAAGWHKIVDDWTLRCCGIVSFA
jgi:hypothetical protein